MIILVIEPTSTVNFGWYQIHRCKVHQIVTLWVNFTIPFGLRIFWNYLAMQCIFYYIRQRITNGISIPERPESAILLNLSDIRMVYPSLLNSYLQVTRTKDEDKRIDSRFMYEFAKGVQWRGHSALFVHFETKIIELWYAKAIPYLLLVPCHNGTILPTRKLISYLQTSKKEVTLDPGNVKGSMVSEFAKSFIEFTVGFVAETVRYPMRSVVYDDVIKTLKKSQNARMHLLDIWCRSMEKFCQTYWLYIPINVCWNDVSFSLSTVQFLSISSCKSLLFLVAFNVPWNNKAMINMATPMRIHTSVENGLNTLNMVVESEPPDAGLATIIAKSSSI